MLIVLKLSNGESVIGLLSFEDDEVYTIQDPFHLDMKADTKGYRALVMYRYNQFSNSPTMDFQKPHVVSTYYADEDLTDYYFYTLDHTIKFRDKNMSADIQRACDYIQQLIDNNNVQPREYEPDSISVTNSSFGNTVH